MTFSIIYSISTGDYLQGMLIYIFYCNASSMQLLNRIEEQEITDETAEDMLPSERTNHTQR